MSRLSDERASVGGTGSDGKRAASGCQVRRGEDEVRLTIEVTAAHC